MDGLSPWLVWGLMPRFIGLLYVVAFAALIPQHEWMPGSRKLLPLELQLSRMRRDYPGLGKYFRFPTLLWLNSSDAAVRALPYFGVLCGFGAIYGGALSFPCLLLGFMFWLSLEFRSLFFPWDTLLQEAGFLALFLPASNALPDWNVSALPLPDVAFAFRWLVIRLMLGFAKDKFVGSTPSDNLYLRGFMVWMPLPAPLAWWAHHAPRWFLKLSLYFMFYAEVIAPVLGLFSGPLRIVSCVSLVALMIGIGGTGNWGFFNYGYSFLCIALLDVNASLFDVFDEPWRSHFWSWPDVGVHAVMLALLLITIPYLLLDSWLSRAWVTWPKDLFPVANKLHARIERIHRWFEPLRWLAPFRFVNAYGVFPPNAMPPLRIQPVLEGSMDGEHWRQYGWKHMPSFATSKLGMIAPYHARLDQWSYYVGQGIDGGSLFGGIFPGGSPYWAGMRFNFMEVIAQRILNDDRTMLAGMGHNPFPEAPPRFMRVGLIALTPTSPAQRMATGEPWSVRRLGTYAPARGIDSAPADLLLPEPELFMPEFSDSKREAAPLKQIVAAYAAGMPVDRAVVQGSDLSAEDVQRFWTEVVPLMAEARGDWSLIHQYAATFAQRYSVYEIHRFERLLERFTWLLLLRTEKFHWGDTQPTLPPLSSFRFHKLLHEVVLDGRAAYQAMLDQPVGILERNERSTLESQLWAFALLRYDHLMSFALIFRVGEMGQQGSKVGMPGLFEYYELLANIELPQQEFALRTVKHPDGEHTVEGFYPPVWPKTNLESEAAS
ncbi:MAG TPA: lipase maturation factor family protein [Polyangiales bacterium]|nr:lipase maturation factor family protein [Polyangiales bacterium]